MKAILRVEQWRQRHELSGFSGLPGGYRQSTGSTTTLECMVTGGVIRPMAPTRGGTEPHATTPRVSIATSKQSRGGHSVRCIQDAE